jgi:hypothetical protein
LRVLISIIGIAVFLLIGIFMLINTPANPQLIPQIQNEILPTYNQVIKFVEQDDTNKNTYNGQEFNCLDYANGLKENATQSGFKCAVVVLGLELQGFTTASHAIVCFETQDRGQVFIEPQSDK